MLSFSKALVAVLGITVSTLGWASGANKEDASRCYNPSKDLVGIVGDGVVGAGLTNAIVKDFPKTKAIFEQIELHQNILNAQKNILKEIQASPDGLEKYMAQHHPVYGSPLEQKKQAAEFLESVERSIVRNSGEINKLRESFLRQTPYKLGMAFGLGLVFWDACGRVYRWALEDNQPQPISEQAAEALLAVLERSGNTARGLGAEAMKKKIELRDLLRKQRSEYLRNEEIKAAHSTEQKDPSAFPIPHSYLDTRAP